MSRRLRNYRRFLYVVLAASTAALIACWLFMIWDRIPSAINIRAGMEQALDLNVPVSGKIYKMQESAAVSGRAVQVTGMDQSARAASVSLPVDLSQKNQVIANELQDYTMELKLFGVIPFKTVDVHVIQDRLLTPAGIPIGIYVKTEGILVIATGEFNGSDGAVKGPAQKLLKEGDYILKVDGEEINSKTAFINLVKECGGSEMILTIRRDTQEFDLKIKPEQNQNGEYKLGIWVRDNAQGVGTLTYVDDTNGFGALGHGINDMDTSTLMNLKNGSLYRTEIVSITRGESGTPGELTGVIDYKDSNKMGAINANTLEGIFGNLDESARDEITSDAVPIGLKQEVELGDAQILCSVGDAPRLYQIKLTALHLDHDNINRGIELQITDEELLQKTGGIVQGMSGSPILQNGKIIGAVTHVLVQDPAKGYGIFIENMLSVEQ